ncbi:hypothetical protein [Achromobacter denitrificans]|uniref:hypothetical protein n=1 Tax=Achromobacter denitrificans TaxID=32002 RepID=UPI003CFE653B
MSKPNLPDLPYSLLETLSGDEINEVRAYAEEAVRQALAAQVPVAYLSKSSLESIAKPWVAGCAAALEKAPRDGFVAIALIPETRDG